MYHRPADYPSSSPNENGAAIGANSGGVVGGGTGEGVVQGTRVRKRKWDLEGAPRSNKWDVPGPSASSPMTGSPGNGASGLGGAPLGVPAEGARGLASQETILQQGAAAIVQKINQDMAARGLLKPKIARAEAPVAVVPQAEEKPYQEVVINDAEPKLRQMLTRRTLADELLRKYGAVSILRGVYRPAGVPRSDEDKPLHLHLSPSKTVVLAGLEAQWASVNQAKAHIEAMMGVRPQGPTPGAPASSGAVGVGGVGAATQQQPHATPAPSTQAAPGTMYVPVNLPAHAMQPAHPFNAPGKLRGDNNANFTHIALATGANVWLHQGGVPGGATLHLGVAAPTAAGTAEAARLCENLAETVVAEFWRAHPAPPAQQASTALYGTSAAQAGGYGVASSHAAGTSQHTPPLGGPSQQQPQQFQGLQNYHSSLTQPQPQVYPSQSQPQAHHTFVGQSQPQVYPSQSQPQPQQNFVGQSQPLSQQNFVGQSQPQPQQHFVGQSQPQPQQNFVGQSQSQPQQNFVGQSQPQAHHSYGGQAPPMQGFGAPLHPAYGNRAMPFASTPSQQWPVSRGQYGATQQQQHIQQYQHAAMGHVPQHGQYGAGNGAYASSIPSQVSGGVALSQPQASLNQAPDYGNLYGAAIGSLKNAESAASSSAGSAPTGGDPQAARPGRRRRFKEGPSPSSAPAAPTTSSPSSAQQAEESAGGALGRSHHGASYDRVPGYSSANGAQGCRQAGNDVLSSLRSRVRGAGPFPLTKPVPLSQAEARRLMPPPPPRRPAPELGSRELESAVSRESTGEGTAGRDYLSKGQPPAQNTEGIASLVDYDDDEDD